jgi:hypothetical protein
LKLARLAGLRACWRFRHEEPVVAGFVTRFSSTGALRYKTILGGSDREWIHGVAVSSAGEPVVVGESYSPDYPVTAGAYATIHGFKTDALGAIYHADAFVTRLNATGQISYSTFIGGDDYDLAYSVALAPNGAVVVAGETMSPDWPTTAGAYDRTHNCCTPYFGGVFSRLDAFVARLSADGSAVLRCYVSSTGALIGTLTNEGGGRYRGQFSWSSNPQNVTVRSSLGGSATRAVAAR